MQKVSITSVEVAEIHTHKAIKRLICLWGFLVCLAKHS